MVCIDEFFCCEEKEISAKTKNELFYCEEKEIREKTKILM